MSASRGRALILVENLSVPFDRRVWQEASSLGRAGYDVSVICPRGRNRDTEEETTIDGVRIHRYPLEAAGASFASYGREYATALRHTAALVHRLSKDVPFDVIHACNPPDVLLLTALPQRRRGTAFVFDQHDLVPELFVSRFERRGVLLRATRLAEQVAFRLADVVISTNESYRRVALTRGRKRPEDVFVVRSAPNTDRFRPVPADPALRGTKQFLLGYLGVMGPQDGVDHALRALARLRAMRDDWRAIFIGSGDVLEDMQDLAAQLGLADVTEFTGRIPDGDVIRILSSADVCLSPDPKNALNDVSTMNKVMEYMALERPIVSYDLVEARVSAGDAALYAAPDDVEDFAHRIDELLRDETRRKHMGKIGRARVAQDLSWDRSEQQLLAAYERALVCGRARS